MLATRMMNKRVVGEVMGKNAFTRASYTPVRAFQTDKLTPEQNLELLNSQRAVRPSSPHLTIYQPQLTSVGSIANRVTGVGLSAGIYAGAIAYVAAPLVGAGFDAATLVDAVATAPEWLKVAVKTPVAAAFSYHSWNGLRHLAWDAGKFLTLKGAYSSGYAVLGATAISTIALVAL